MPTTLAPPLGWRVRRGEWARAYAVRQALLPALVRRPLDTPQTLPVTVCAFSCERDVPERVASVRALIRHAGRPVSFTVVSDGTHSRKSRRLLAATDPCVRVVDWRELAADGLPPQVRAYAARSPMGKKLAVELSLPIAGPTAYVDSDVLFLRAPTGLAELVAGLPRYLVDSEEVYLDRRLLRAPDEAHPPANAGFFTLSRPLDWAEALGLLHELPGVPGFHTEQTLVHLALRAAGARPLDPRRYVVATDDMASRGDPHRGGDAVLRHYTSPVRHKFWLAVAGRG